MLHSERIDIDMGRRLNIEWEDSEQSLQDRYQRRTDHQDRVRLQALWLLREGRSLSEVASVVGKCYETVRRWTEWYRSGGLEEVLPAVTFPPPRRKWGTGAEASRGRGAGPDREGTRGEAPYNLGWGRVGPVRS